VTEPSTESRIVGLSAVAFLAAFIANFGTWFAMLDWDPRASDPDVFLSHVVHHVGMWRFSQVTDFLSYVVLVPLVLVFWERAGKRGIGASVATLSGLAFAIVGGVGAIALLGLWPYLFVASAHGSPFAAELFSASWYVVPRAIWNGFDAFALGIWLLWAGTAYKRRGSRVGLIGIAAGVFALGDALGYMSGLEWFAVGAQILWGLALLAWFAGLAIRELRPAS